MLVIETNGDSPVRRATAAEVEHRIVQLFYKCSSDASYLSGANPNVTPTPDLLHQNREVSLSILPQPSNQPHDIIHQADQTLTSLAHTAHTTSSDRAFPPSEKDGVPIQTTDAKVSTSNTRHFACPFFQKNPQKHWKACSKGWPQLHRVKYVSFVCF